MPNESNQSRDELFDSLDERNAALLRESIAHWNDNVLAGFKALAISDGETSAKDFGASRWSSSCPLCKVYAEYRAPSDFCNGCPVRDATGLPHCYKTPWVHTYDDDQTDPVDIEHFIRYATQEVNFLRGILADLERG